MFLEEGDRSRNGVPTGWRVSQQQHAVAVAVKPVALESCVPVSAEGEFAPPKGADQQEGGGPGEVKVREECARDLKLEPRVDEKAGFTSSGNDPAAVLARDVFERAHARGAHGDDAPPLIQRAVNRARGPIGNFETLALHFVVFHTLRADRLESPQPDVDRDLRGLDPTRV